MGGSPALGHQKNDKYQDPDDESVVMDQFCEKWTKPGGTSAIHLYQRFGNMPSGRYRLSAVTLGYNQSNLNVSPGGCISLLMRRNMTRSSGPRRIR